MVVAKKAFSASKQGSKITEAMIITQEPLGLWQPNSHIDCTLGITTAFKYGPKNLKATSASTFEGGLECYKDMPTRSRSTI